MKKEHIARWRMHNLRLSGAPPESPEEVVHRLGAVQSQDYGPAKWSVAERTTGVSDAAMDLAFADGTILRTHVLRPTWHFVLPADIGWMLELTAPRVRALTGYYYRQLGLDDSVLDRCSALLAAALQGGDQLTRKELRAMLGNAGVVLDASRFSFVLMDAELRGIICSGALKGKQHTYALLEERAPQARSLTKEEALAELTLRYFTSHGPATPKDFRWWSSLLAADIRKGLELVESHLEHEVVDGLGYWFVTSSPTPKAARPTVHLLQGYDEYIVGYSESRYLLDASRVARSLPQGGAIFNDVVILDGQLAGHWKRTLKKDSVIIEAALYTQLDDAQTQALQAAADRHGEFLGLTPTVLTSKM
ncbi:MAG: winged helix DNA-binding domain-containing protein [Actinomycetota bacterium]